MSLRRRRARPLLGTIVEISVMASDVAGADIAIDGAFQEVERIQNLLSFHDPESELSRLNRERCVRMASRDLVKLLIFSQDMWRRTGGAFNVAVAPRLIRHGYLPGEPNDDFQSGTALDYSIEGDEILLNKPIGLDLGGVAKGYAVDRAIESLRACGIESAIVIAGGDLRAYGELRDYFIRNPQNPQVLELLGARDDVALATSAGYFADPESHGGFLPYVNQAHDCVRDMPSITVSAPSCMMADALTKFVLLSNPNAEKLQEFSAASIVRRV